MTLQLWHSLSTRIYSFNMSSKTINENSQINLHNFFMDYSKNPIKILAILSLISAAIVLLCSWQPLTYNNQFSPQTSNSSILAEKDELEVALEKASMAANKTVIIAIINKAYVEPNNDEYPSMFDLFLEGFWVGEETRPLLRHLLVVSMDSAAHERCLFRRLNCYRLAAEGGGDGFAGEKIYMSNEFIGMMWRRTSFVVDVLKRGYSFIFTDTDVLWLRDPFTRLINTNESLDLQISTDAYNGHPSSIWNPINTGFYFIKSSNKTTSFFQKWYEMRRNSTGMKEQDVLVKLVRQGVLRDFGLNARFLDTLYFSGFCKDSHDVRLVVTVHANCCRSIRAKVVDLKAVLRDWKRFKDEENNGNGVVGNSTDGFRWSKHVSCLKSWHKRTL